MRRRDGFLVVRVGERRYGLPLTQVRLTADLETIQPVPAVQPAMLGMTHLRGQTVPVLDLEALLTGAPAASRASATVVLAGVGPRAIALAVDDVEGVRRESWQRAPTGKEWPWALGVVRDPDGIMPVVDVERVTARLSSREEDAA